MVVPFLVWRLDHRPSHHSVLTPGLSAARQLRVVWIKVKRRRRIEMRRKTAEIVHYKSIADLGDGMAGVKICTLISLRLTRICISNIHSIVFITIVFTLMYLLKL